MIRSHIIVYLYCVKNCHCRQRQWQSSNENHKLSYIEHIVLIIVLSVLLWRVLSFSESNPVIYKQTSNNNNWKPFFFFFVSFNRKAHVAHALYGTELHGDNNCVNNNRYWNRAETQHTMNWVVWIRFSNQMVWFIHIVQLRVVQGKLSSFEITNHVQ